MLFDTQANAELDAIFQTGGTLYLALSTTAPAADGTNITEPAGNGYARKQADAGSTNWNAAASRQVTSKVDLVFAAATGSWGTPMYVVVTTASSGGTPKLTAPIVDPDTIKSFYAAAGTDTFTSPAHGFVDNDVVQVWGPSLPGGVSKATTYHVITAATDTFQLSLTQGGAAIDVTSSGFGRVALDRSTAVGDGETIVFPAGSLVFEKLAG